MTTTTETTTATATHAILCLWSDCYAYEIVRKVSDRTIDVRAMDWTQTAFPKHVTAGGFVAHVADPHAAEYAFASNPANPIVRIRLGKRGWKGSHGRFVLATEPRMFADPNF